MYNFSATTVDCNCRYITWVILIVPKLDQNKLQSKDIRADDYPEEIHQ